MALLRVINIHRPIMKGTTLLRIIYNQRSIMECTDSTVDNLLPPFYYGVYWLYC